MYSIDSTNMLSVINMYEPFIIGLAVNMHDPGWVGWLFGRHTTALKNGDKLHRESPVFMFAFSVFICMYT